MSVPIRRVFFGSKFREPFPKHKRVRIDPEISMMLAQPSWSVRSLLPRPSADNAPQVTREQLHHLLKLSALPLPKSEAEEKQMLETLESQIHFVKEVQKINTNGVEPLVAIRDETADAIAEQTITLEILKPYLDQEERVGTNGTIRRRKPTEMIKDSGWNPFETGAGKETRKMGKFFYVKKVKEQKAVK